MQTRLGSWIETLTNTTVGFILSSLMWPLVVTPIWGIHINISTNLAITALFTIVSILRGYCLRRLFNLAHKNNNNASSPNSHRVPR